MGNTQCTVAGSNPDLQFCPDQYDLVGAVAKTCAAISFVGSTGIICSWLYFSKLRTFSFHLVTFLAISDCLADIAYFLGSWRESNDVCQAQAALMTFGQMATILWTSTIAYTLYSIAVNERVMERGSEACALACYHACVWGASGALAFTPLVAGAIRGNPIYGETGAWCWVRYGDAWRFVFYGFLWAVIAANIAAYIAVYGRVKGMADRMLAQGATAASALRRQARVRRFLRSLRLYPAILIFCWTVPTFNRIWERATGYEIYAVLVTQAFTVRIQGFLNSLAYGYTQDVRRQWHSAGCTCCPVDAAADSGALGPTVDGSAHERPPSDGNAHGNAQRLSLTSLKAARARPPSRRRRTRRRRRRRCDACGNKRRAAACTHSDARVAAASERAAACCLLDTVAARCAPGREAISSRSAACICVGQLQALASQRGA